jgi:predicted metal-dependent hydrolase
MIEMSREAVEYDPRYLAGILFFNRRDFFEAHEVWEDLWAESTGTERRFYQGLIQAAVALYHFGNGNRRGALRLYRSSQDYMKTAGALYLGLDVTRFWQQMEVCCAGLLQPDGVDSTVELEQDSIPTLELNPPPSTWPDPDTFITEA